MVITMDNWNATRWLLLKRVTADASLVPMARLLATVLVTQFSHHQTGHCAPGNDTLAAALGTSADTIKRALRALSDAGWLTKTDGRGRGKRSLILFEGGGNVVPMIRPDAGYGPQNATPEGGRDAPHYITEKGAHMHEKGGTHALSYNKADPKTIQRARATAPLPERPMVPIDRGSTHEAQWNDWLRRNRWPSLVELDPRYGDGWAVPLRSPPHPDDPMENRIAQKWVSRIASAFKARAYA